MSLPDYDLCDDSSDDDFETQLKLSARDKKYLSASRHLKESVQDGRADRVRRVLAVGGGMANMICSSEVSRTALHHAAECGHVDIVELLCDRGASLDPEDSLGLTPAKMAFFYGRLETLDALQRRGANMSFIPQPNRLSTLEWILRSSVVVGNVDMARIVIVSVRYGRRRSGVRKFFQFADEHGRTPLTYAAWYGHTEVVKLLLDHVAEGVVVDAVDKDKQTPLAFAVGAGRVEVVKLLLRAGASATTIVPQKLTLVNKAVFCGQIECLRALLKYLPSVDFTSSVGETALYTAASIGCLPAMKCLLEYGANPNLNVGPPASTPLLGACIKGKWQSIVPLVLAGADVNQGCLWDKITPLKAAGLWGKRRCLRVLLRVKELKVDFGDPTNWTALQLIVMKEDPKITHLLLRAGADKLYKVKQVGTNDLMTAEDIALMVSNHKLAKLLREFEFTLADRCMAVIRQMMPSPLTEELAASLPIPRSCQRKLLFLDR